LPDQYSNSLLAALLRGITHLPIVKSGMAIGALPAAMDASLNAVTLIQAAAS
jgi:hypothetical protein